MDGRAITWTDILVEDSPIIDLTWVPINKNPTGRSAACVKKDTDIGITEMRDLLIEYDVHPSVP